MANFNIDNLDPVSSINDADLFEVEQGGVNKKVTGAQLKSYIGSVPNDISRFKGDWTTANLLPGGSGTKKANFWRRSTSSTTLTTADGSLMPAGMIMMANKDNPSSTDVADWIFWNSQ